MILIDKQSLFKHAAGLTSTLIGQEKGDVPCVIGWVSNFKLRRETKVTVKKGPKTG